MKLFPKLFTLAIAVTVLLAGFPNSCRAETYEEKTGKIAADVLVYRPAGLLLTIGGGAIFLLALPVTAISGGTKATAKTLVATPFDFTFRRPVGTDLRAYTRDYGEYEHYHDYDPNCPICNPICK